MSKSLDVKIQITNDLGANQSGPPQIRPLLMIEQLKCRGKVTCHIGAAEKREGGGVASSWRASASVSAVVRNQSDGIALSFAARMMEPALLAPSRPAPSVVLRASSCRERKGWSTQARDGALYRS